MRMIDKVHVEMAREKSASVVVCGGFVCRSSGGHYIGIGI